MAWIESHQSLRHHPKTRKLARRVGDIHKAIGLLQCLWWWALDYAEDGDLTKYSTEDIAIGCDWDGDPDELAAILCECCFIEAVDGGYQIHDWQAYAGKLMERRARNAERMREARSSDVHSTCNARATHVPDTCKATNQPTNLKGTSSALRLAELASSLPSWRERRDDEAFFTGQLEHFTEAHIEDLIRRFKTHQESRPANARYKDARKALGNWLKRETPDPMPVDESQLSNKQRFMLAYLRDGTLWAHLPESVEQLSEWKRIALSGITEAEVPSWR